MEIQDKFLTAVAQRKLKLVRILLQGGVDIEYRGYDGKTALIVTCSFVPEIDDKISLRHIVSFLLSQGAKANAQDIKGRTAIMYAFRHHLSVEIVQMLLKNGADPFICDMNGTNAFGFLKVKYWKKYESVFEQHCQIAVQKFQDCALKLYGQKYQDSVKEQELFRRRSDSQMHRNQLKQRNCVQRKCVSFCSDVRFTLEPILENSLSIDGTSDKDDSDYSEDNNQEINKKNQSGLGDYVAKNRRVFFDVHMAKEKNILVPNLVCDSRTNVHLYATGSSTTDFYLASCLTMARKRKCGISSFPRRLPPLHGLQ